MTPPEGLPAFGSIDRAGTAARIPDVRANIPPFRANDQATRGPSAVLFPAVVLSRQW